jgi:hypothetical protein
VAPLERSVTALMEKLDRVHVSNTGSRHIEGGVEEQS